MRKITIKKNQKQLAKPSRRRASKKKLSHSHLILLVMTIAGLLTVCIGGVLALYISLNIPNIRSLEEYRPPQTTIIQDRHGTVIDRIFIENRQLVTLDSLPDLLPKAFLASEDARFYDHSGVDAWSITRALIHNLSAGSRAQGGSTITQQVARALLLSPEKTYTRKIKEAILAYRIDHFFSKDEILQIYLNQIYFGSGAYGIETAAQTYFGKAADQIGLAEISLLAGLPQAPSRYSPFKNFELAKKRQVYVLNRMAEDGYITPTAARKAFKQPLSLARKNTKTPTGYQFFLQQVRNHVQNKYGSGMLTSGGLVIHTTLDQEMQQAAVLAVHDNLEAWRKRNRQAPDAALPQAALIALEANTGKIRALVGGADFNRSQYDRAVQARRQPGSAFKPIIYAAALAQGLTPGSIFMDQPLKLQGATPGSAWQPKNFSGENFGPTTIRDGLIHSRNIVTIKILQEIGIDKVLHLARNLGISSRLAANLSLALGTSELSLLELTGAYTAFANNGRVSKPYLINKISTSAGHRLEVNHPASRQILEPETAFQVTHMLEKVIEEGTGRQARGLKIPVAGKTGTSDKNMDAWFVGYSPDMVTGVWMGFDKNRSLGRRETGGRAAAPGWRKFMAKISGRLAQDDFAMPENIKLYPIDMETGELATEDTVMISWEAFRIDNPPPVHQATATPQEPFLRPAE